MQTPGTSGNYITIKAENDGGAVVTSTSDFPLRISTNYIRVEGLKFVSNLGQNNTEALWIEGEHNKIFRCAFVTTANDDPGNNTSCVLITGNYNLMEDCWAWGGGRYTFIIYGGNSLDSSGMYNILRRCVARHDRDGSTLGNANFTNYTGKYNLFQNCIGIDSDQESYYGYYHGIFFWEKGYGSATAGGPTVRGSIGLNYAKAFISETNSTYYTVAATAKTITDSIAWDGGSGITLAYYNVASHTAAINHFTGGIFTDGVGGAEPGQGYGLVGGVQTAATGVISTNSIYYRGDSQNGGGIYNVRGANDYNAFYGNTTNLGGSSTSGAHDKTNVNPLTASLRYLPRIEASSPLKGAGSGGSDIGATVLYKWGTSGAAYGEAGYDTITTEPLWPWPNEARIKADMSSYPSNWPSGNLPNPVRGFTAGNSKDGSPQTLTKYIWEYLGNQIPADIYGGSSGSDTTAPTVTSFTMPSSYSSLTIPINIFTASDNVGVTGYCITTSSSSSGCSWSATPQTSVTFSSTGNQTAYAWAKDAAGNVSTFISNSVVVSTPTADTTAPVITSYSIPATSTSLTVPISTFTATDVVGVTGFCVTTTNSSSGCTWSATAPASVTFSSTGSKTSYAWAKDAAGNVSASVSATTTITSSSGHVYYVRPDGHDSASGANNTNNSSTGAWLTLQKAANTVVAGDTVYVADGTYTGFMLQTGGSSSNRITFKALGTGANIASRNQTTTDNINLESYGSGTPDYITIDGFNVYNSPRRGIRAIGGTGIIIQNCTIHDNASDGILTGGTPNFQVLNNTIYSNGSTNMQHNVYISNYGSNYPIVRGNTIYGSRYGNGLQLNGDWTSGGDANGDSWIDYALVENNKIYNNAQKGMSLISVRYGTFQNNIVYGNGVSGAGAAGIHIVDQQGMDYSINNFVVNNTIDEPRLATIRINSGNTGNIVFNNISIGPTGIVFEGSGNFQSSNSTSSSGFANYASHDYHLTSNSTAKDAGLGSYQGATPPSSDFEGNSRPQNGSFDRGAYELGTALGVVDSLTIFSVSPD
jgi:parallel beta-helix repeat protein